MKAPSKIECQKCKKMVCARYLKGNQLPPGIIVLGYSACPRCHSLALHVSGDPQAVQDVMESFEEAMGIGDFDLTPTDLRTGKPAMNS